ncbi:hypothetical protein C8F04DRAFT_1230395 [Mycena alexandri]|uniref:C2H2-type domain-containing protein n=1 Tax=Mycena alexandri TaxID=1745969 RepID=A0AAD6T7K5_9AGAR|nr:hypothetical protein C8F04DRAFT_1230395 [Mycena alexandri]
MALCELVLAEIFREDGELLCPWCTRRFDDVRKLQNHLRNHRIKASIERLDVPTAPVPPSAPIPAHPGFSQQLYGPLSSRAGALSRQPTASTSVSPNRTQPVRPRFQPYPSPGRPSNCEGQQSPKNPDTELIAFLASAPETNRPPFSSPIPPHPSLAQRLYGPYGPRSSPAGALSRQTRTSNSAFPERTQLMCPRVEPYSASGRPINRKDPGINPFPAPPSSQTSQSQIHAQGINSAPTSLSRALFPPSPRTVAPSAPPVHTTRIDLGSESEPEPRQPLSQALFPSSSRAVAPSAPPVHTTRIEPEPRQHLSQALFPPSPHVDLNSESHSSPSVPRRRLAKRAKNSLPPSSPPPPTSPTIAPADGTRVPQAVATRLFRDHPDLIALGVMFNLEERVVICIHCEHAILPTALIQHVHKEHGIPLPYVDDRPRIIELCASYSIHKTADSVRRPSFGCAPLEGLHTYSGFVCRGCQFAARERSSLDRHWSRPEHKEKCGDLSKSRGILGGSIQSFFNPGNQRWFEVEPSMKGVDPDHPFALYQSTYGREFDKGPTILHGAENGREVLPMSKLTGWDDHLSNWLTTRSLIDNLRLLVDLKKSKNDAPGMGHLRAITKRYHDRISKLTNSSSWHVRCLLMDCPRTDSHSRAWKVHTVENTINKYCERLQHFVHALLRSVSKSPPTTYQFPLTDLERQEVQRFAAKLNKKAPAGGEVKDKFHAELVDDFHSFLALFFLAREPTNPPPVPSAGKFSEVLECFCAVHSVREDGFLQTPRLTAQLFDHLKYLIRAILLCEADKRKGSFGSLEESVNELGMRNLAAGRLSPFNMVVDYQRATSAMVYRSVLPPQMLVSDDSNRFTYHDKTLDFPAFKFGLKQIVGEMRRRLDALMFGLHIPISFPKLWVDDWSNETRLYSFRSEHRFTDGARPWLKGLFCSPDFNLVMKDDSGRALCDSSGEIIWNRAALLRVFAANTEFIHLAMPLMFIATAGSRGQEFADAKIANGPRPRSVFVEADGRVWIVTRRGKVEGQTDATVFIPAMLPDDLAQILLTYLIVIRPGLVELAHVLYDAHISMLYREFLWVVDDKLLDSDDLCTLLQSMTRTFCGGVAIGLQPWRQVLVEIYRIYLGSEQQVIEDEDENDIFAARMGHTVETGRKHYAIEFGTIPFLSSERLSRFRSASILHHQLFSLLPGADEILPLMDRSRLRTRRVGNEGGLAAPATTADAVPQLRQLISSEIHKLGAELSGKLQQTNQTLQTVVEALSRLGPGSDVLGLPSLSMDLDRDVDVTMFQNADVPRLSSPSPPHIASSSSTLIPSTGPTGAMTPVDALALLRDFLNDPDATWKSDEQAEGVRLALARLVNFILILNVGEGKTLVYQLPAYYEQNLWTLVVCPNKTLLNDQLESCRNLGLGAIQWYSRDYDRPVPAHTNIIFVALETAAAERFRSVPYEVALDHMDACDSGSADNGFRHAGAADYEDIQR